jgi:hypothetical protein
MSSLDMLATWPLLASTTTLYSAAGALKAYMPCMSVRPLANTLSLSSSINSSLDRAKVRAEFERHFTVERMGRDDLERYRDLAAVAPNPRRLAG